MAKVSLDSFIVSVGEDRNFGLNFNDSTFRSEFATLIAAMPKPVTIGTFIATISHDSILGNLLYSELLAN
jgi:hypothetical protein